MDDVSADKLHLGDSSSGVLGPLALAAGLPDNNYNVNIYVRVFDSLHSFSVYAITPVKVIIRCCGSCQLSRE